MLQDWKPEEIEYLKEKYSIIKYSEIAKHLNKPVKVIRRKCFDLGLLIVKPNTQFIIENYPKISAVELAKALGISYNRVNNVVTQFNLSKTKLKPWTDEDINFLKVNMHLMTSGQIAKKLDRTYISIYNKINDIKEAEDKVSLNIKIADQTMETLNKLFSEYIILDEDFSVDNLLGQISDKYKIKPISKNSIPLSSIFITLIDKLTGQKDTTYKIKRNKDKRILHISKY